LATSPAIGPTGPTGVWSSAPGLPSFDDATRRASQGAGPQVAVPQRRRRLDPDTGRYRRLSAAQRQVNTAHARMRGPGERVNAELQNWKILRKIRSYPNRASELVAAVQTLMIASV
jgi:hypothetical protein